MDDSAGGLKRKSEARNFLYLRTTAIAWRNRTGLLHEHHSRLIVDYDQPPLPAYDALKFTIQQAVSHKQWRKHASWSQTGLLGHRHGVSLRARATGLTGWLQR